MEEKSSDDRNVYTPVKERKYLRLYTAVVMAGLGIVGVMFAYVAISMFMKGDITSILLGVGFCLLYAYTAIFSIRRHIHHMNHSTMEATVENDTLIVKTKAGEKRFRLTGMTFMIQVFSLTGHAIVCMDSDFNYVVLDYNQIFLLLKAGKPLGKQFYALRALIAPYAHNTAKLVKSNKARRENLLPVPAHVLDVEFYTPRVANFLKKFNAVYLKKQLKQQSAKGAKQLGRNPFA